MQKKYELLCSQYKSHGKVWSQSAFLGAYQFLPPLGRKTVLRVSDFLFRSWKMGTIIVTSQGCHEDRVR